jgi:hypothetical protein
MKNSHIRSVIAGCLAPAIAFAHPGHFDDSQLAHDLSHGLFYLFGLAALALLAKQHGPRLLGLIAKRKRQRR